MVVRSRLTSHGEREGYRSGKRRVLWGEGEREPHGIWVARLTRTSPEKGHLFASGGKRQLGVTASRTPRWGETVALIFPGSVSKLTFGPREKESVGPAQAGLGGGACGDPEDGGGAGRRGTGNSLAETLRCPQAWRGTGSACSIPGRAQAPAGPRSAAYSVPGGRRAHARAMAEVGAAAEPTRTLLGGGGACAPPPPRAPPSTHAQGRADPERRPRVVVRSTTPGPLPRSFATHPSPSSPPRALDSALT